MQNRAEIVDRNFIEFVTKERLPEVTSTWTLSQVGLSPAEFVDLFESQMMCRHLDLVARRLKARGESFYTIGSAGHEGNAAVAKAFRPTDIAFLHYRSGAFYTQRSKQVKGSTPLYDILLSLVASSDDPISGGRHKVFGSVPLNIPPQTSTIASHLPKAVGAGLSIPRTKALRIEGSLPYDSVAICTFGDASMNHASALAAFNTAGWCAYQNVPLPLVFVCEDNQIGISVPTPFGWVEEASKTRPRIIYISCDGRDLLDTYRASREAARVARIYKKPVFLHVRTVRLLGHAGSDVEILYKSQSQIKREERDDPLLHSAARALQDGLMTGSEIVDLYQQIRARVDRIAEKVIHRPKYLNIEEVARSLVPKPSGKSTPPVPPDAKRKEVFGTDWQYIDKPQHLAKQLNWALQDIMLQYNNTVVFGEDVAQKGGVYHVTAGLHKKFGARRVYNSLLDETSILGNAIGMAHNNILPIPEIQFLAYVHNAEDQIRGEAATLPFFSDGKYANPMVIRIAGLAYQKGFGGHFHNDNSLAVFRDIPGLIVACPSTPADGAKMLRGAVRAAHRDRRVVVFLEPIALYMTKDLHEPGDNGWLEPYPDPDEFIDVGEFGVHHGDESVVILTYGNGTYLSMQAREKVRAKTGLEAKLIDMRWIAPVDEEALMAEIGSAGHVLIVDECRKTGSQSEAWVTMLVERSSTLPNIKRITGDDCFVPLGMAATAGLPALDQIESTLETMVVASLAKGASAKTKKKASSKRVVR